MVNSPLIWAGGKSRAMSHVLDALPAQIRGELTIFTLLVYCDLFSVGDPIFQAAVNFISGKNMTIQTNDRAHLLGLLRIKLNLMKKEKLSTNEISSRLR
jgi:hypothetical protein